MKMLKWLLGAFVIDPLVMLFIWNVLVVLMFGVERTSFWICMILSVFANLIYYGIKSNSKDNAYSKYKY
jgi:uncharacterized membrane protein YjjB (DUF3815 family)